MKLFIWYIWTKKIRERTKTPSLVVDCFSLSHESHKMFKHTQKIRRQIGNELFECVWPFCGIDAKSVKLTEMWEGCTSVIFKFFFITKN